MENTNKKADFMAMDFNSSDVVEMGNEQFINLLEGNYELKLTKAVDELKTTPKLKTHQTTSLTIKAETSKGVCNFYHTLRYIDEARYKSEFVLLFQALGLVEQNFTNLKLPLDKLETSKLPFLPSFKAEVTSSVYNGKTRTDIKRFIPSFEQVEIHNNDPKKYKVWVKDGAAAAPQPPQQQPSQQPQPGASQFGQPTNEGPKF